MTIDQCTAWELAQFAKRIGSQTCYDLTEAHLEDVEPRYKAYLMIHEIDVVARALVNAEFSSR